MPDSIITLHKWTNFNSIGEIFTSVIEILLVIISVLALASLIYGGYQYITSSGNPEAAQKAKSSITWGIIGLILAFASFIIVNFIYTSLTG